ncbi:MAG TPA: hypothetical protein VF691_15365 [Cytophagaceae bacterium]|jgi:hypothetical protein
MFSGPNQANTMKHFLITLIATLILSAGSFPSSADVIGKDKKKGYSNQKIVKRNNKKRHKAGKPMKFHSSSSQGKKRNYPFS